MSDVVVPWLRRLERTTLVVGLVMAAAALGLWPDRPARAAGVLGGLALVAISYRGIVAGVSGIRADAILVPPAKSERGHADPESAADGPSQGGPAPSRGFVKFFTRHAILAVGAYVMIARFEFDPMAMLVGVTAPAMAATVEVVRTVLTRSGGSLSR